MLILFPANSHWNIAKSSEHNSLFSHGYQRWLLASESGCSKQLLDNFLDPVWVLSVADNAAQNRNCFREYQQRLHTAPEGCLLQISVQMTLFILMWEGKDWATANRDHRFTLVESSKRDQSQANTGIAVLAQNKAFCSHVLFLMVACEGT